MPEVVLAKLETKLLALEHDITWHVVGRNIRHGTCNRCGLTIVFEGRNGFHHASGPALEQSCLGGEAAGNAKPTVSTLGLLATYGS